MMKKINRTVRKSNKTVNDDEENEDPLEKEKSIVRKKITKLTELISEIEFSLNLKKFGNIQLPSKPRAQKNQKRVQKFKNLDYILQHELCKLSGLYCTKCTKHEFIFNFSPLSTTKSNEIYGVQFFTNDQKGTMGKYVMPTSGIMEDILVETPIDQLTGLIPFFKNCRRHLDCFIDRKEQFESLKESMENVKNFYLDADMGFVFITCILRQCYTRDANKLVDITVYLSYDYGKARPSTINVDWSDSKPKEEETKAMRSFVKAFKSSGLREAMEEIEEAKHKVFTWRAEEKEEVSRGASLMARGREEEEEENEDEDDEEERPKSKRNRSKKRQQSADADKRQEKAPEVMEEEEVGEKPKSKRGRPKKPKNLIDTGKGQKEAEKEKSVKKKRGEKKEAEAVEEEPVRKKKKTEDKEVDTFKRPKTRQSLLNFKKVDETIGSSEGKPATTSTPMRRDVNAKGGSGLKGLKISPIVKDAKEAKRGRKPSKKK